MKKSAVVLLSGGLDSSVNLYWAALEFDIKMALTFDYGQRAASKEIASSQQLTKNLRIPHQILKLDWFSKFSKSSLTDLNFEVPQGDEIQVDDLKTSEKTAQRVWVPNRNGIFLNIAAAFAEGLGAKFIIPGFNVEEAQTFPDNSENFMKACDVALAFSTANQVQVYCPTVSLNKNQIVKKAMELKIPLMQLWPCYHAFDQWCGQCESCQRFQRALGSQGLDLSHHFKESR